ncbi:(d)CMP kinase [Geomicrobium sp. JCM 19039]|uniref:(d)CMP kinase n=1 Tax=Geomicrobium sp. JCM 19039 TaxID=1460636 RepID=UPI00045F363D|nr:(d)CMP kinase [Geomicrobium sp. JCM 19039]GAK11244.1 cytidylate kinase [Geomicrobium sp. JCM 19039]
MTKINIAIDGPAGSGKSTVALKVANELQYLYIDTGAMYRALAYRVLLNNISLSDENTIDDVLKEMSFTLSSDGRHMLVNNEYIGQEIRSASVTHAVSEVSSHHSVRLQMLERQQELAKQKGVVLDGRDIGTHVLPDAELKVYLFASVDERASRRHLENIQNEQPSDLQTIRQEIERRDHLDTTREFAPLRQADDAISLDTTQLSIEDVVRFIYAHAREKEHTSS